MFDNFHVSGSEVFRGAAFGEGIGPIFLEQLVCRGEETELLECAPRSPLGVHSCSHSQDAGVKCIGT